MTALELAGYSLGGALATGGLWAAAVFGRRALVDAYDARRTRLAPPALAIPAADPLADTEVLVGVVVPGTELMRVADVEAIAAVFRPDFWLTSGWRPTRLEPALICDDVLTGLPWQTLSVRELTR